MTTMIPTPDEILLPDGLVRLARNQYPEHDRFTDAAMRFGVDSLMPVVAVVYFCESCSCRFLPDNDGGLWYRDRVTFVNGLDVADCGSGAEKDQCVCHGLPYSFKLLPGHCATCECSIYEDMAGELHHVYSDMDSHDPIHVVPVTEQDMDDLKQSLLRIEHDLTD